MKPSGHVRGLLARGRPLGPQAEGARGGRGRQYVRRRILSLQEKLVDLSQPVGF